MLALLGAICLGSFAFALAVVVWLLNQGQAATRYPESGGSLGIPTTTREGWMWVPESRRKGRRVRGHYRRM